jgi:uncharacterized protein YeaO (DUF488 family)
MFRTKRVYEAPSPRDGVRVLVDRLWPRGLSKPKAKVDVWLRDIAPSDVLRRWFGHEPKKWPVFHRKYRAELARKKEAIQMLRQLGQKHRVVTLLYAASDKDHNNAVVLVGLLNKSR